MMVNTLGEMEKKKLKRNFKVKQSSEVHSHLSPYGADQSGYSNIYGS